MLRSMRRLFQALALALAAGGCEPAIPPHTIDVPARLVDVRPPRTVAFVRDDVPLGGLRGEIERAIPPHVEGAKPLSLPGLRDAEVTYRLDRQPVVLRAEPSGLSLEVALIGPVGFRAGEVRCQTDSAGLAFLVATRPALRPDGALVLDRLDWKPVVRGTLSCGPIPVPLGAALSAALEPLARGLAQGVKHIEIPLGPAIRAGLDKLRPAQGLKVAGNDACLDLDPGALVLAPVGGAGAAMTLKLGVDVAPRVTLGACSASNVGGSTADHVLVKTVPLQDHFEVAAAVAVPYTELETRAAPAVVGHKFGDGDRAVTIDAIALGDAQGRVLARVTVHGVLNGDLYVWGAPEVVEQGGRFTLKVPDLRVALESRSVIEKVGLWVWQLVGGGLEGLLRDKLTLDVTDKLKDARAAMSGRHDVGPAVLTTELDKIRPGTVTSRTGALVLYPTLVGRAELSFGH